MVSKLKVGMMGENEIEILLMQCVEIGDMENDEIQM